MLDRIRDLNPAGLVATRGEPTKMVSQELEQTQGLPRACRQRSSRSRRPRTRRKRESRPSSRSRRSGTTARRRSTTSTSSPCTAGCRLDGTFAPAAASRSGRARGAPCPALRRGPPENEDPGRLIKPAGKGREGDGSSELTIALFRVEPRPRPVFPSRGRSGIAPERTLRPRGKSPLNPLRIWAGREALSRASGRAASAPRPSSGSLRAA